MKDLNEFINDLSVLISDSTNKRDKAKDTYKALEKVTKSARDLFRNLETLRSLNGGEDE